jgi:hypothetical protein
MPTDVELSKSHIKRLHNYLNKLPSRREHKNNALNRHVTNFCTSSQKIEQAIALQVKLLEELTRRCKVASLNPTKIVVGSAKDYVSAAKAAKIRPSGHENKSTDTFRAKSTTIFSLLDSFFAQVSSKRYYEDHIADLQQTLKGSEEKYRKLVEESSLLRDALAEKNAVQQARKVRKETEGKCACYTHSVATAPSTDDSLSSEASCALVVVEYKSECSQTESSFTDQDENLDVVAKMKSFVDQINNNKFITESQKKTLNFLKMELGESKSTSCRLKKKVLAQTEQISSLRERNREKHKRIEKLLADIKKGSSVPLISNEKEAAHCKGIEKKWKVVSKELSDCQQELSDSSAKAIALEASLLSKKQEIIFLQSKLTETTIANETESFIADRRQREKSASELKNAEKCNALKAQIRMLEERSELSASALQADVGKKSREITQLKEEVIELKDELGAANMCLNLRRREKIEEKKQHESILKEFESKCNRLDIMNVQQNETLQKSIRLEREIFAPLATDLKASGESKSTPPPKEMLLELYKLRTLAWEQALKKT